MAAPSSPLVWVLLTGLLLLCCAGPAGAQLETDDGAPAAVKPL